MDGESTIIVDHNPNLLIPPFLKIDHICQFRMSLKNRPILFKEKKFFLIR